MSELQAAPAAPRRSIRLFVSPVNKLRHVLDWQRSIEPTKACVTTATAVKGAAEVARSLQQQLSTSLGTPFEALQGANFYTELQPDGVKPSDESVSSFVFVLVMRARAAPVAGWD
jgi:hypothetical protein